VPDESKLLVKLNSSSPSIRYEACEELRVLGSISPQAITVLRDAMSDTDRDVADAAKRAYDTHTGPAPGMTTGSFLPPVENADAIIVTTGDLRQDYEVIGPVFFQVSNKGILSSQLSRLAKKYDEEIAQMREQGQIGQSRNDWGFLIGEWSVGQSTFEQAFYIAVQELKKRAAMLKADTIVGMRQDIDLDTNAFQFFYLQIYGTAVRFLDD
jgi:hypothetical protein